MSAGGVQFGVDLLTTEAAYDHTLFLGATGSGKTTLAKMLLRSVIGTTGGSPRALVYDPKKELLPVLDSLGRFGDCLILNPLDRRCAAWDIAQDFTDPISARQFATILTQSHNPGGGENRFWVNAVRDILTMAMVTFMTAAPNEKSWTFRDLILAVVVPSYLEFILSLKTDRENRELALNSRILSIYFRNADDRTRANVIASIQSELSVYEPIAAIWAHVMKSGSDIFERRFSLANWVKTNDVLVLGNDESARASIDPINQAMFQRAGELLLNQPSKDVFDPADRTWLVLDEVREAGSLPILGRLLNKGRSHGVTVVLAFQDVEGLIDVYGESVASEVMGQCGNKTILKLESPDTADWACRVFGDRVGPETGTSRTTSTQGSSFGTSTQDQQRPNVINSDFLFLPKANVRNGISYFVKHGEQNPHMPHIQRHANWQQDIEPNLPPGSSVRGYLPHESTSIFHLRPWSVSDWDRLGFPGAPPAYDADVDWSSSKGGDPE